SLKAWTCPSNSRVFTDVGGLPILTFTATNYESFDFVAFQITTWFGNLLTVNYEYGRVYAGSPYLHNCTLAEDADLDNGILSIQLINTRQSEGGTSACDIAYDKPNADRRDHAGIYRCIADNGIGADEAVITLDVQYPPEVVVEAFNTSNKPVVTFPVSAAESGLTTITDLASGFAMVNLHVYSNDGPISIEVTKGQDNEKKSVKGNIREQTGGIGVIVGSVVGTVLVLLVGFIIVYILRKRINICQKGVNIKPKDGSDNGTASPDIVTTELQDQSPRSIDVERSSRSLRQFEHVAYEEIKLATSEHDYTDLTVHQLENDNVAYENTF
ncbi:hypothetical protein MAR_011455, partial [Mya arenaria]